ncbi:MAG: hypothetical protein J3K34DRAFT_403033 [Monoraphidium minutum]|nr:MAG: hypothetical protein J3K34DRAFT_403033 [Monoraphidium minutum]
MQIVAGAPWFRNLVSLTLTRCHFGAARPLGGLAGREAPALRRLRFDECYYLGDGAARDLARLRLPALEALAVKGTVEKEYGGRPLPGESEELTRKGTAAMMAAWGESLEEIDMQFIPGDPSHEDSLSAALAAARLPRLRSLRLALCGLRGGALAALAAAAWASQLTSLDLSGNPLWGRLRGQGPDDDDCWGRFAAAPWGNLRALDLRCC